MSRKGNCYDNATMESFWALSNWNWSIAASLKTAPRLAPKSSITSKHSIIANAPTALDYNSPVDFETLNN
jgi:transposase InsO family protein